MYKTNNHFKNINFTNEIMKNKTRALFDLSNWKVFLKRILINAVGKEYSIPVNT